MRILILIILISLISVSCSSTKLIKCDPQPKFTYRPQPQIPSYEEVKHLLPGTNYLHYFQDDDITVEFIITKEGIVESPQIVKSVTIDYGGRVNGGPFPEFYHQSLLREIKQFTYPARKQACLNTEVFKYRHA